MVTDYGALQYFFDVQVFKYAVATASLASAAVELPGVFSGNPFPTIVNASLWTLKFEVLCYIILAIVGRFGFLNRQKFSVLMMATWLVAGAVLIFHNEGVLNSFEQAARFWLCFSFGIALFVFRDVINVSCWIAAGLALLSWITMGSGWERIIAPVATGYGALWLGSLPLNRLREFTNRVDLSYGVYIFGWPISQTLVYLYPQIGSVALIIYSGLLAVFLAILSWHLVEKPALAARWSIGNRILSNYRRSSGWLRARLVQPRQESSAESEITGSPAQPAMTR